MEQNSKQISFSDFLITAFVAVAVVYAVLQAPERVGEETAPLAGAVIASKTKTKSVSVPGYTDLIRASDGVVAALSRDASDSPFETKG